jgi:tetratricopeptide (TPR) repeat protein
MEIDRKTLGANHPYVATRMNNLAWTLVKKGDYKSAEELFGRALEIQRKTFAERSWEIANTKLLLGACLKEEKKYPEAESLMLEAFPIIEKSFGIGHPRAQAQVKRLVDLYEAWGKPDRAATYKAMVKVEGK